MQFPTEIPLLPIGDVCYPSQYYEIAPNEVAELKLVHHLAERLKSKSQQAYVCVVPVSKLSRSEPVKKADVFHAGVVCSVFQITAKRNGGVRIVMRGLERCKVVSIQEAAFMRATIKVMRDEEPTNNAEFDRKAAGFRGVVETFVKSVFDQSLSYRMLYLVHSAPVGVLADTLVPLFNLSLEEKKSYLTAFEVDKRIDLATAYIRRLAVGNGGKKSSKLELTIVKPPGARSEDGMGATAGGAGGDDAALNKLRERLEGAGIPKESFETIEKDLSRLSRLPKSSAEYDLVRSYLEFCADLPWAKSSNDSISLTAAKKQLEDDHCGLEPVKRRIVEYLAVLKMRNDMKGPILCLIGPPGVGKSSLGQSVADALGRKFCRISLGGVRDEAVIRGHRRTYVGAMHGRLLDALKKAGTNNPVILLDEIDKMGMDTRGDPAAALLEVLDPVQNNAFTDHYLGVPFDLSKVLFIATGNSSKIPSALKDRMEMIEVPGYSFHEKISIAKTHLLPKQLKAHGMAADAVQITDAAYLVLAHSYTRESGVRTLDRLIASIVRYVAAFNVMENEKSQGAANHRQLVVATPTSATVIDVAQLSDILGPTKYEEQSRDRLSRPGVSTGLGYTGDGSGSILYIESTQMPGKGKLTLTGQLGDVMKESAQTALGWIRSNAALCRIEGRAVLDGQDIHIHFPAGATPKDGPSAGVAIAVALVSLLSNRLVRDDVAMTGELSLSGIVLPVGGIKGAHAAPHAEKVLAAHRHGIKTVVLPKSCMKDLHDVPKNVRDEVAFVPVTAIEEVLSVVFAGEHSETRKRSKL